MCTEINQCYLWENSCHYAWPIMPPRANALRLKLPLTNHTLMNFKSLAVVKPLFLRLFKFITWSKLGAYLFRLPRHRRARKWLTMERYSFVWFARVSLDRPENHLLWSASGGEGRTGGLPDTARDRNSPLVTFYQDIKQTTNASTSFLGKHSFFSFARILPFYFRELFVFQNRIHGYMNTEIKRAGRRIMIIRVRSDHTSIGIRG